jgi:hypothetical protein
MNDKVDYNYNRYRDHAKSERGSRMIDYMENYPFLVKKSENCGMQNGTGNLSVNDFENELLYPFSGYLGNTINHHKQSKGSLLWRKMLENRNASHAPQAQPKISRTKFKQFNNNYKSSFKNGKLHKKVQIMDNYGISEVEKLSLDQGPFKVIRK